MSRDFLITDYNEVTMDYTISEVLEGFKGLPKWSQARLCADMLDVVEGLKSKWGTDDLRRLADKFERESADEAAVNELARTLSLLELGTPWDEWTTQGGRDLCMERAKAIHAAGYRKVEQ